MYRALVAPIAASVICFALIPAVRAQTVWSGYDFSFAKADNAPPSEPANQDRITDLVWISRSVNGGIFNVNTETAYVLTSPADTEWATYLNNPSDTIAATNYSNLTFAPWIEAYGGQGSLTLPARLTGGDAVLHLITDDIYLDIRFTDWSLQCCGGFGYVRAMPPPGPETTGDYNLDGFVDAADYVRWRKTLGDAVPEGTGADGVPDGTIDDADYNFWVSQFGTDVSPGGGGAGAVPEPSGLSLAMLAVAFVGVARRRGPRFGLPRSIA